MGPKKEYMNFGYEKRVFVCLGLCVCNVEVIILPPIGTYDKHLFS